MGESRSDALTPDYEFAGRFEDRARGFIAWLISLDEPGNEDRKTVTLTKIIERAEGCLPYDA